jgi:thiol-disulfide isomerase/thioredoxin
MSVSLARNQKPLSFKMALTPRPEDLRALSQALIGGLAPSLHGEFYQGEKTDLESLRGKVVLIDFWATWCGPCRMTMPSLNALHREYGPKGLVIIGISNESQAELNAFQKRMGLDYPLMRDPEGRTQRLYQAFAYPTLALLGKDGKVARIETGAHSQATMEAWIRELL